VAVALVVTTLALLILAIRVDVADRIGFAAYLAVEVALITACMVLAEGLLTLHYAPVMVQAALACRRRVLVAICAGLCAQHVAFGAYYQSATSSAIELIGFLAAAAFIAVFAEAIAAERRARASVAQLATMQERNRLAREIHDSLGHYLTVIHLQLEIAARGIDRDVAAAAAAVQQAKQLTRDGLEDVRRSVAALRAPLSEPLADAIGALVAQLAATGTAATFAVRGDPRPVPPAVSLTLFRTAQETLTNVEKHADASHVAVELDFGAATVELRVRDDGRGGAAGEAGFGLRGVRERVALVGGRVEITSTPGEGFHVRVVVPAA
jgi:signal transduction histidine kinase